MKNKCVLNSTSHQPNIDKMYLYAKDPNEAKYKFLINKREKVSLRYFENDPKAFIKYSNDMKDVYKNTEHYDSEKENELLIVFDDIISDMIKNKKPNLIVTELFTRDRSLNISIVFITQSYLKVPKEIRLNTTHFFIMKIQNKREL